MIEFIKKLYKKVSSVHLGVIVFALVATASTTAVFATPSTTTAPAITTVAQNKSNYVNGLTLNSNVFEYPQNTDMTEIGLENELADVMNTAKNHGFNSVFFKARTANGSFYSSDVFSGSLPMLFSSADPLKVLCEAGGKNSVKIYTLVDVFNAVDDTPPFMGKLEGQTIVENNRLLIDYDNDDSVENLMDGLSEIVKNYDLEGIVLTGFDDFFASSSSKDLDSLENKFMQISKRLKSYDTGKLIGISVDMQSIMQENIKQFLYFLCENDYIDLVVPQVNTTSDNKEELELALTAWKDLSDKYDAKVFTENLAQKVLSPSTDGVFFRNPNEIIYQLYFNHSLMLDGNVVSSFEDIKRNRVNLANSLYQNLSENDFTAYKDYLPAAEPTLEIPSSGEVVLTDKDKYYITGTSNPGFPLYMDGDLLERQTTNGTFGVEVSLEDGLNEFKFIQNAQTSSVLINKQEIAEATATQMDKDTALPIYNEAYHTGDVITLSVSAPSGAKISAMLDGNVYPLKQVGDNNEKASQTYSTEIKLSGTYPSAKDIGNILYSMSYNGTVTNCKSLGKVYVANKGVDFVARVSEFLGELYVKPNESLSPYFSLKEGSTDIITSSFNNFYLLASSGYIKKSDVNIVTDDAQLEDNTTLINHIDNVVIDSSDRGETFTLIGCDNSPVFIDYNENEDEIYAYIYNTENFPVSLSYLGSELFNNINVDINDENVKLTFKLNENTVIWGIDYSYSDGNAHLIFKTPPKLPDNPLSPLKGINIFINPLFGGEMRGELSPISTSYPDEADLNLINAYMLALKLRALGANVVLSRNGDISYAFDDRLKFAESISPDIVINLSHSFDYPKSDNKPINVYYTSKQSGALADKLSTELKQSFYYDENVKTEKVDIKENRISYAPCVSIEIGDMSNIEEYEKLCDMFRIYKFATSISSAVHQYLISQAQ